MGKRCVAPRLSPSSLWHVDSCASGMGSVPVKGSENAMEAFHGSLPQPAFTTELSQADDSNPDPAGREGAGHAPPRAAVHGQAAGGCDCLRK